MRYQQPFGISDVNAAYINGNPETGVQGSIPPAFSIEHPQREIVNMITASGLAPNEADLNQLVRSVQNGAVNFAADNGTPNFIAITPTPVVAALTTGLHFRVKVAAGNTGPTKVNVSNLGWFPLRHGDGTEMGSGELYVGQIIDIVWDAATPRWQMLTGGLSGQVITLTSTRAFYCNATTGDDNAYDGSAAAIDSVNGHGPFKTLRKALQMVTKYNLSGFQFYVYLADGIYLETASILAPVPNGSGQIVIVGNQANPQNVKLYNAGDGSCFQVVAGSYIFDGVSFQCTNPIPGDSGISLWVLTGGTCTIYSTAFFSGPFFQMYASGGGLISIRGPISIFGGGAGHIGAGQNGCVVVFPNPLPTLNLRANATYAQAFCLAESGGQIACAYNAINMNALTITGQRYVASSNGVINVNGRGTSYLPGTIAGAVSTGGQYV
jgi:hypothetical protein